MLDRNDVEWPAHAVGVCFGCFERAPHLHRNLGAFAPLVLVGEPEAPSASDDPCAGVEEKKAERQAAREASDARCAELESAEDREHCMVDPPGDPDCSSEPVTIDKLVAP